jgi:hypothetical protein
MGLRFSRRLIVFWLMRGLIFRDLLCKFERCASEVGWNAGESPARRVGLFTTEHDLNSVAARRGWKLRKMNRWAVMKLNHIQ